MSLYVLDQEIKFPPVGMADEDGLLAIGGDLSKERILYAYRSGIFPWYESQYILWWCPDPRFVLFPQELKISNSMKQLIKKKSFEFSVNRDFEAVIHQCKLVTRKGQQGTWITDEMEEAYISLHEEGFACSAEVWKDGRLAGGLYGVRMGKVFFGESMFSLETNASKFAFISYVQQLQREGVELIDCQVYTHHLESLGARMIPRTGFCALVRDLVQDSGIIQ